MPDRSALPARAARLSFRPRPARTHNGARPARSALGALAALGLAVLVASPAAAESPVLVTLTGTLENANRGPMDPDRDKLFLFTGGDFDAAHAFDLEGLKALPQAEVAADFPAGGDRVAFRGPTFADLLDAAGAQGDTVIVQALDGYAVEVPRAELEAKGAILALELDGEPLGIGGMGPAMVAFPRAEREDLADMNDDWWVWQVFHVRVE
jgi:hypothetical protein